MRKLLTLLLFTSSFAYAQPTVAVTTPTPLAVCDDNNDGFATFDLSTKNAEILGSLNPSDYTVSYHETEVDAINGTVALPLSYVNISPYSQTVYARVQENANTDNFGITSLSLEIATFNYTISTPNNYVVFETPYDGITTFDLTSKNESIIENATSFTFSYHTTLTDAQNNVNPITNPTQYIGTNNQEVYIRVVLSDGGDCSGITSMKLVVLDENNRPQITTPSPVTLCDTNNNGTEPFALTTKNSEILGSLNPALYTVTYFFSNQGAYNNDLSNQVPSQQTEFGSTTIYVRVQENTNVNNFKLTSFQIINSTNIVTAHAVSNLLVYDNPFDGFAVFDLTQKSASIIGNQTGMQVVYYTTQTDAQNNTNPITQPQSFANTENQQIIWARVFNGNTIPCNINQSITSFKLVVVNTSQIINIPNPTTKSKLLNNFGISTHFPLDANTHLPFNFSAYTYFLNPFYFVPCILDQNGDGEIQVSEAQEIKSIMVDLYPDLTGINNFSNLEFLGRNIIVLDFDITSLDVSGLTHLAIIKLPLNDSSPSQGLFSINLSGCTGLKHLNLYGNNLSSLDLNGLTNLEYLNCQGNQISSLDLSDCTHLKTIYCYGNSYPSLDVSNLTQLELLSCGSNSLATLNVNGASNLKDLRVSDSQLTSLDMLGLTNINHLECSNNQITTLDVGNLNSLNYLKCNNNNQLQSLFLKNGITESTDFSGNPNLHYICTDNNEIESILTKVIGYGYTNCEVNSYCSFTPGGDYNTITGTVKFDANNNGCDATDISKPNIRIDINNESGHGATFTNNSGVYNFYTPIGSFNLTPTVENESWFSFSPTTISIPFTNNNNNTANQDFCITPVGNHADLEVVIAPTTPARPGFDAKYQIVFKNKGNQTLSGAVSMTFNDDKLDFVTANPTPTTQQPNTLTWDYTNLLPFENRSILVTLNVNSPTETPAVNIGDQLNFNTIISPTIGDETPFDNSFSYKQIVVGSYDPNDITCLEGAVVSPSEIGSYLHYSVNFENTGTYPAENIVVKMEVDPTQYDINSLQLMNTSHNATTRINGNKIEFIFEGCNLDSGGHGNILFKMKTLNNLQVNDEVTGNANIYFDYNFPVNTNDATTVFQSLNNPDFVKDENIQVYPNPASNFVTVNAKDSIQSIALFDVNGRLLQTIISHKPSVSIDLIPYSKGIYFIKTKTEKGINTQKIIKE